MGAVPQFLSWFKQFSHFPLGKHREWWGQGLFRWYLSSEKPGLAEPCSWSNTRPPQTLWAQQLNHSRFPKVNFGSVPAHCLSQQYHICELLLLHLLTGFSALSRTWAARSPSARDYYSYTYLKCKWFLEHQQKKVTALTLYPLILNHHIQLVTGMKMHCSVQLNT